MTSSRLEPRFIDSSAGRIFVLLRAPAGAERCVLCVPAFGEEMNKSRAQLTATAKRLVDKGFAVLVVDLYGTGDSEGDFSEARWTTWIADVEAAARWAEGQGLRIDSVLANRLGCILAADALAQNGRSVDRTVFWQPVASGAQFMTQFLRLRVASSMMQAGDGETVDGLKACLAVGETLEVAGYPLSPELFGEIDKVTFAGSVTAAVGKLTLFELGRAAGELSAGTRKQQAAVLDKGVACDGRRFAGEPFWNATEIVVHEELARATVDVLAAEAAE